MKGRDQFLGLLDDYTTVIILAKVHASSVVSVMSAVIFIEITLVG